MTMSAATRETKPSCEALRAQARACRLCRDAPSGTRPLPHEPRPVVSVSARARILIASQAPGTRAQQTGLPFDDASGDRLRAWLGLDRTRFYGSPALSFLPMGFCFPGQDRKGGDLPPRPECAPTWRAAFLAAMPDVEAILAIGRYAQDWHLKRAGLYRSGESLAARLARWGEIAQAARPALVMLPHPSWRNTGFLRAHPFVEAEIAPYARALTARLLMGD